MPIKRCRKNGKPGFKFGDSGTCYTYTPNNPASRKRARNKAARQEQAAHAAGFKEKK
jgi:hypothetical protein